MEKFLLVAIYCEAPEHDSAVVFTLSGWKFFPRLLATTGEVRVEDELAIATKQNGAWWYYDVLRTINAIEANDFLLCGAV